MGKDLIVPSGALNEIVSIQVWDTSAESASLRAKYYKNGVLVDTKYITVGDALNKKYVFHFVSVLYANLIWRITSDAKKVFNVGLAAGYYGVKNIGEELYAAGYDAFRGEYACTAFLVKR